MGRALILDSDRIIADSVCKKFADVGFEAVVCDDAQDAISQIDYSIPDVVILEITNRYNSGVDFLYELRSYADWSFLPVVVYTRLSSADVAALMDGLMDVDVSTIMRKADVSVPRLVEIALDTCYKFEINKKSVIVYE